MQRRQFLALSGVGLGGCVGASGGSGPRNPPTTPAGGGPIEETRRLRIVDAVPREGEEGALVLVVTVENTAEGTRSDTLVARATIETEDGTTEYETSRAVAVDAGATAEVRLLFDVSHETWQAGGGLSYGWEDQF